jgi:hypothetical protein
LIECARVAELLLEAGLNELVASGISHRGRGAEDVVEEVVDDGGVNSWGDKILRGLRLLVGVNGPMDGGFTSRRASNRADRTMGCTTAAAGGEGRIDHVIDVESISSAGSSNLLHGHAVCAK